MGTGRRAEWGSARSKLVAAAQEILLEEFTTEKPKGEAIASAFAFLDPSIVAERAGVARSAFYHHWGRASGASDESLTPFQRFVGEVFESEWGDPYDPQLTEIAAAHNGTFAELVAKLADAESRRYDGPEGWAAWRASVALAAYGGSTEENIDAIHEVIAAFYETLLERFDLRMRAPFTTFDAAASIMAFLDGLWMRRLYGSADPNPTYALVDVDTGEVSEQSLAAFAVGVLVEAMTEPDAGE